MIVKLTKAELDVIVERRRHVDEEGFTPEQDDQYQRGQLSLAGASYALSHKLMPGHNRFPLLELLWPWPKHWWKPTDRRRDLVKAASLIIAEIELLDRAAERVDHD